MSKMTVTERQALRQVIRQRMKVLRSDVAARKLELLGDVEEQVRAYFADVDKLVADLQGVIDDKIGQLRKDIQDALLDAANGTSHQLYSRDGLNCQVFYDAGVRASYRRRLTAEVEATCAKALVEIDRMEADLVTEITVDGLETEAAKNFLGRIPTVGELVPAARIMEITQ